MNIKKLAFDAAFAVTGVAAVYFACKYDALSLKVKKENDRKTIWDMSKSNMMENIDSALATHLTGLEDVDLQIKMRSAILRNRVYEACDARNDTLRSQVEQEIQEFQKHGR